MSLSYDEVRTFVLILVPYMGTIKLIRDLIFMLQATDAFDEQRNSNDTSQNNFTMRFVNTHIMKL